MEEMEKEKSRLIESIKKQIPQMDSMIAVINGNIEKFDDNRKQSKSIKNSIDTYNDLLKQVEQYKSQVLDDKNIQQLKALEKEGIEINKNLINSNEDINGMVRIFIRVKGGKVDGDIIKYDVDGEMVGDKNITINYDGKPIIKYGPFYDIFNKDMTNENIFNKLDSTFDQIQSGYHIALFGYGYSGSGKSYTLINKSENDYGVLIRAVKYYLDKGLNVSIDSIKELYNNTYNREDAKEVKDYGIKKTVIDMLKDNDELKMDDLEIKDVKGMVKIIEDIELKRTAKKRIKATINNPVSSRGHLFITLNVGDKGKLTICDMAGREDPLEIWENSVIDLKTGDLYGDISGNDSMYIGSVSAEESKKRKDNTDVSLKNLNAKYKNKFDIEKSTTITGRFLHSTTNEIDTNNIRAQLESSIIGKSAEKDKDDAAKRICESNDKVFRVKVGYKPLIKILDVIDTCKEAHYINETLNHMIYYFDNLKGIKRNIKTGIYEKKNNTFIYHPERLIFDIDNTHNELIGMIPILEKIQGIVKDKNGNETSRSIKPPKYCLFACARQEKKEKFLEASIKTLEYAYNLSKLSDSNESENPKGLKELRNTILSEDQTKSNITKKPLYSDKASASTASQPYRTNRLTGPGKGGKTIRINNLKKMNKTQKNKKRRRKTKTNTKINIDTLHDDVVKDNDENVL